jgi:hypothetical protein
MSSGREPERWSQVDVVEPVVRRSADGKREFYAAAFANSVTEQRPEETERERMLGALGELRRTHLRLLATVAQTHDHPPWAIGAMTSSKCNR